MQTERRRHPRKILNNLAYINIEPNNGGIVVDVSEGGLRFHSVGPVLAKGEVKFWFSMHSTDHLDAVGELVWTDDTRKTGGIRFIDLPYDARARLRSMLGNLNFEPAVTTGASRPAISEPLAVPAGADLSASAKESLAIEQELESIALLHRAAPMDPSPIASNSVGADRLSVAELDAKEEAEEVGERAEAAAEVGTAADTQRATILNSPLSLLATSGAEVDGAAVYRESFKRPHVLTGLNDAEESAHGLRSFLLVVLLAVALTAGGYYVYRWKTSLNASAAQRLSSPPISAQSAPDSTAALGTASPNSPANSSQNAGPAASASANPGSANSGFANPAGTPSEANEASTGVVPPPGSAKTNGPTLSSGGDLSASSGATSGNSTATPTGGTGLAPVQPETAAKGGSASSADGSEEHSSARAHREDAAASGSAREGESSSGAKASEKGLPSATDLVAAQAEVDEARELLTRGPDGRRRDPAHAARLLWDAVGKGSVAAEIDLADLYARGDGVTRNCEQARVLLQAAIGHGSQTATDRLSDLIHTGCRR